MNILYTMFLHKFTKPQQLTSEQADVSAYQHLHSPRQARKNLATLQAKMRQLHMPTDITNALDTHILPHYVKLDALAQRYHQRYLRLGLLNYTLITMITILAGIRGVLTPEQPMWAAGSFALLLLVLGLLLIEQRAGWRQRWLDYRFLAERLRSSMVLAVAGLKPQTNPPAHLAHSYQSTDWILNVYRAIWQQAETIPHLTAPEQLRNVALGLWIDEQIAYFTYNSTKHQQHNLTLQGMVNGLIVATLSMTVLELVTNTWQLPATPQLILNIIAIAMPALATMLQAIKTLGEHEQLALRYNSLAQHLEILKVQLQQAQSLRQIQALLIQIDAILLHENISWRVIFQFQSIDVPMVEQV